MGRVRLIGEGAPYHLMARGNNRRRIFQDDEDRVDFLRLLGAVIDRRAWVCLGYCLMENHIHLVATTTKANVDDGMRDLLGRYARRFNRRYGRTGHLFSERYRMVVIGDEAQLLATIRYVALNPSRAGLASTPREWVWGSYSAIVSGAASIPCVNLRAVLDLFHHDPGRARELLERFVEDDGDRRQQTGRQTPGVHSLVQTLGPRRALDVATTLGHTGAAIAAVLEAGLGFNDDWLSGEHSIVKPRHRRDPKSRLLTPGTDRR